MRTARSRAASAPLAACAAIAFAALTAFAMLAHSAQAAAPATVAVAIAKFAFEPKEITVAPGTRVVWTNRDDTPHTVTSADKSFASKGLDTGDTFETTLAREGDFAYICTVHPYMTGVVHVRK